MGKISNVELQGQLSMYGWDILCGFSKGTFEIPHKIAYPYIVKQDFIQIWLKDLRLKSL